MCWSGLVLHEFCRHFTLKHAKGQDCCGQGVGGREDECEVSFCCTRSVLVRSAEV